MTDPTLLRRAIESVGIEKPSDYTLVMEEVERLMDEQKVMRSRQVCKPYNILEPETGWRKWQEFADDERVKLRPIAETLAMLDGNAFFSHKVDNGRPWHEMYLPEASALYEANGGDNGWSSEASFGKLAALIRAATDLVKEAEEMGFGKTSEKALPGSFDALIVALEEVKR